MDVTTAASRDETLPVLTGVHLQVARGELVAHATDRYRIAEYVLTGPVITAAMPASFLVHRNTVKLVSKLFARSTVQLSFVETEDTVRLTFSCGNRKLSTLLIDGEFPKIAVLFPETIITTATVERAALAKAFVQVAKAAERNTPVRITVDGQTGGVLCAAGTGADQSAHKTVSAGVEGPDVKSALNPAFTDDALKAVGGGRVHLGFTNGKSLVVIADPERPDFRVLLMPCKVQGHNVGTE